MWGSRRVEAERHRSAEQLGSSIHFGVFAFLLAVTMPRLVRSFCPTTDRIDTSWAWMLGYAVQHHLQWGKSILFTYGPLGFLSRSYFYFDHGLWELTATVRLLTWFALGLGFAAILRRLAPDNRPFLRTTLPIAVGWVVGASFLHLSAQSTFLGVLLLVLAIAEEHRVLAGVSLVLAGALLALGGLIKSTGLIVSLFALLIYPAAWWYAGVHRERARLSWVPLLSFIASFCILWGLTAQPFANLPAHLRSTWALASGYTPAMSISGMPQQLALALLILTLFVAVLLGLISTGRKVRTAQCLILAGMTFWAWKEGFTRPDWGYYRHPMEFFGTALLIASASLAVTAQQHLRRLSIPAYGAYAIALLCALRGYPLLSLSYTHVLDNYRNYFTLSLSAPRIAAEQHRQREAIRTEFKLPAPLLSAVGGASVNVLPWSLMLAQGYHLRLTASPLIQSYSVYTPYLDQANARQIWTGRAAEKVIYQYQSLDWRYFPFDEPATFRAMLACYRTEYAGVHYTLLSHRACSPPSRHTVGTAENATMGEWIALPPGAQYARISLHTKLFGHLIDILFKPAEVRISFKLSDGTVAGPYRFIYPVGPDGLFVRYFVGSQSDLNRLFSAHRSALRRITAIQISSNPHSPDYARQVGLRFFRGAAPRSRLHASRPWHPPAATRTLAAVRAGQSDCLLCAPTAPAAAATDPDMQRVLIPSQQRSESSP